VQKRTISCSMFRRVVQRPLRSYHVTRHPERWGRNVKARESNSHHQVEEQSLLTHSTCRNKCSRYISAQRAKTKVTVKAEQDSILLSCLQVSDGGKQTEYRLRNEGEQCRVCQTFWSARNRQRRRDQFLQRWSFRSSVSFHHLRVLGRGSVIERTKAKEQESS